MVYFSLMFLKTFGTKNSQFQKHSRFQIGNVMQKTVTYSKFTKNISKSRKHPTVVVGKITNIAAGSLWNSSSLRTRSSKKASGNDNNNPDGA